MAREVSFKDLFPTRTIGGIDALSSCCRAAMYIKLRDSSFFTGRLVHDLKPVGIAMLKRAFIPDLSKGESGAELQVFTERYAISRVIVLLYPRTVVPTGRNRPPISTGRTRGCGLS